MAMAEAICDVALPSQEQVAIALAASQQWHSSPAEDFDVSTGREPPAVNVVDEEGLDDACSTVYGQHVSDNLSVEADARHEPLCSEESNENNEGRQRVPVRASSVSDDAHADGSLSCFSTDSDETKSAYQTLLAWSAEGSLDYTEAANSLRHTVEEARGTPSPELEASGESDDDDDDVAHDFQHVGCLPGCHTCSLQVGRNELHVPQCITENGGGPHPTVKRTGISDGDLARAKNNLAADQKVSLSQVLAYCSSVLRHDMLVNAQEEYALATSLGYLDMQMPNSFQSTDYPMVNCPATVLPVYFHPGGNGEGCPPFMENAQECSHLPPHTHRSPLKELSKMRQMPLQGSNAKRSRVWDGSGSHTSNGGFRFSGPLHSIPSTPSRRNAFYSGSTGNKIKGRRQYEPIRPRPPVVKVQSIAEDKENTPLAPQDSLSGYNFDEDPNSDRHSETLLSLYVSDFQGNKSQHTPERSGGFPSQGLMLTHATASASSAETCMSYTAGTKLLTCDIPDTGVDEEKLGVSCFSALPSIEAAVTRSPRPCTQGSTNAMSSKNAELSASTQSDQQASSSSFESITTAQSNVIQSSGSAHTALQEEHSMSQGCDEDNLVAKEEELESSCNASFSKVPVRTGGVSVDEIHGQSNAAVANHSHLRSCPRLDAVGNTCKPEIVETGTIHSVGDVLYTARNEDAIASIPSPIHVLEALQDRNGDRRVGSEPSVDAAPQAISTDQSGNSASTADAIEKPGDADVGQDQVTGAPENSQPSSRDGSHIRSSTTSIVVSEAPIQGQADTHTDLCSKSTAEHTSTMDCDSGTAAVSHFVSSHGDLKQARPGHSVRLQTAVGSSSASNLPCIVKITCSSASTQGVSINPPAAAQGLVPLHHQSAAIDHCFPHNLASDCGGKESSNNIVLPHLVRIANDASRARDRNSELASRGGFRMPAAQSTSSVDSQQHNQNYPRLGDISLTSLGPRFCGARKTSSSPLATPADASQTMAHRGGYVHGMQRPAMQLQAYRPLCTAAPQPSSLVESSHMPMSGRVSKAGHDLHGIPKQAIAPFPGLGKILSNRRERERIREINDHYAELQDLLWNFQRLPGRKRGATRGQLVRRKVSKLETLQFAIGYIEELEEQCRSPSGKESPVVAGGQVSANATGLHCGGGLPGASHSESTQAALPEVPLAKSLPPSCSADGTHQSHSAAGFVGSHVSIAGGFNASAVMNSTPVTAQATCSETRSIEPASHASLLDSIVSSAMTDVDAIYTKLTQDLHNPSSNADADETTEAVLSDSEVQKNPAAIQMPEPLGGMPIRLPQQPLYNPFPWPYKVPPYSQLCARPLQTYPVFACLHGQQFYRPPVNPGQAIPMASAPYPAQDMVAMNRPPMLP